MERAAALASQIWDCSGATGSTLEGDVVLLHI